MIWNFIIDFYNVMWAWFVNQIPDVDLQLDLGGFVAPMANAIGYMDTFISLDVVVACIVAVLIADNWALVVRLAIRIWELLPFN